MKDKPIFDDRMTEMIGRAFSGRCPVHAEHCPTCMSGRKNARGEWRNGRLVGVCEDPWHGDEGREYYERLMHEQAEGAS